MSTFGSICANLSITLRAPKSGEHEDQIAPRLARGEQADDRLRHVRQQRRHPVAAADSQRAQATGHPRHLGGELSVAEAPGPASFGIKDYGGAVGIGPRGPQRVTGVVQRGALEPPDVGHDLAGQGRTVTPGPRSPSTSK